MTGAEFSEVDIDLLADYVGGALAGSPDEARVATLVADDPAWRDAYEQLCAATAQVSADLATWGATVEPMPADVAARLDAVLAGWESEPLESEPLESPPDESSASRPGPRHDPVRRPSRPGGRPARRDQPSRPSGRRRRWTTTIGVAAALVLFAGLGITYLGRSPQASQDAAEPAIAQRDAAGVGGASAADGSLAYAGALQVFASGLDYTADTLAHGPTTVKELAGPAIPPGAPHAPAPAPEPSRSSASGRGPVSGDRFGGVDHGDPSASAGPSVTTTAAMFSLVTAPLTACLAAIDAANGAAGFRARSVDNASYQGEPALIVRFSAANGDWAWASADDCGKPGVGARKLAAVRVR